MKMVIDENIPAAIEAFAPLGELVLVPGRSLNEPEGRALVQNADVLVVRSVTQVNAQLLGGSRVKFVGSATIGAGHLDIDYLQGRGIGWSTAPGCNANSVVDYVLSAIAVSGDLLERLFAGEKVGIIGHGNVGRCLSARLQGLGLDCCAYDPLLPAEAILTSLNNVLNCSLLCLHAPLTRSGEFPSFHSLSLAQLCGLPKNAVVISAGRGEVIATEVLLALTEKRPDIRLVLDVWEPEPDIPLALLEKTALATPHIAGYSADGKLNGTLQIAEALANHLALPYSSGALENFFAKPDAVKLSAVEPIALIREAILAVYDIRDDDQRLRKALAPLAEGHARARAFDQLRKNYPQRRELGVSDFILPLADPKLEILLSALQGKG